MTAPADLRAAASRSAAAHRARAILRTEAAAVGLVGCGDNSCRFVPPSGMATNGGCQCEPRYSHWTAEEQNAAKELIRRSAGLVRRLAERIATTEAATTTASDVAPPDGWTIDAHAPSVTIICNRRSGGPITIGMSDAPTMRRLARALDDAAGKWERGETAPGREGGER